MNKTVLFLMNGFGIEQINSYNVYNSKITPNLDNYVNNDLFTQIESKAYDLKSGYRNFSTGSNIPLSALLIDNYLDKFNTNNNLELFTSSIKDNGKIHLFLSFENEKNIEHLKNFIKYIRNKKNNPIYLHLVLTSHDYNDYKDLERLVTKIIYDVKDCKIGMMLGKDCLLDSNLTSFLNMFENEIGENWKEINKKFSALLNSKVKPCDVKEFFVNNGFKLDNNDSIFFFNYEFIDLTNFVNILQQKHYIDVYSMFGVNGAKYSMFAYPKSGISMLNNLKKIDAKALIVSNKENIQTINYYCCGMENLVTKEIEFTRSDSGLNSELIKRIIKDSDYNLIIINYPIDDANNITELNEKLSKLDHMLKFVHDFCLEQNITLFITSLFGIQKTLSVDNYVTGNVDFYGKVPFIVVDNYMNKANCMLNSGNTYDILATALVNINNKFDGATLIRKKTKLEKALKK